MKDFENIGKHSPFRENSTYVASLIDRCTELAISADAETKKAKVVPLASKWRKWIISAASVAAVGVIAVATFNFINKPSQYDIIQQSKSLDQVLAELPDENLNEATFYAYEADNYAYEY